MGALAADPLLSLVDTALVGRLGAVPLAALGIDAALFTTLFWLFNFLTYGTTAEVARLVGAGRPQEAGRRALQALWLALGAGAALTVLLQAAGPALVALMGAEGPVREPALDYLRIRAFAAAPVLVVMVGHGVFRGLKDTRTPLVVALATNALNALLSWVLIYPAGLGITGAAWGTLVAQTLAAGAFLLLARRRVPVADLRVDRAAMRSIVQVSRDLFLRTASLLAGLLVTTAAAARMGTDTVAAHQVARELWILLALVLDGFAVAAQAMVAGSLGAGRPDRARAEALALLRWGVGAGLLIGAAYLALAGVLPRLFTDEPAVLARIGTVWAVVALLQPIGGVVFVLDGVFMGAGDFRYLRTTTALAALGVLAPVAVVAAWAGWGIVGIWTGMAAMMLARLLALVLRLRRWESVVAARGCMER